MNKTFPHNKQNHPPTSLHVKSLLPNKTDKSKPPQKTNQRTKLSDNHKNKTQNKQKFKQIYRAQNNDSNNNLNKNNISSHSRTKSQSRHNQKQCKLISSRSIEKLGKSNRIKSSSKQVNKDDNIDKLNLLPNPFDKKIESDINNTNFFKPSNNSIKIDWKKISKDINMREELLENTTNFENLKYISLNDVTSLFNAWQNSSLIYKNFEEKILKKNNFEINKKTLELITKNQEACNQLKDQKFWILYIEYLINNNLLINEKQFLSAINEAFTYMGNDCAHLRIYYLQKIKKYSPCFLPDGTFDDRDDTYLNKLNKSTVNFIKMQKDINSSNIKLKSTYKKKNYKIFNETENDKIDSIFLVENKSENELKELESSYENKKTKVEETELEIDNKKDY